MTTHDDIRTEAPQRPHLFDETRAWIAQVAIVEARIAHSRRESQLAAVERILADV